MMDVTGFNEPLHDTFLLLHSLHDLLTKLEDRMCHREIGVSYQQFSILVTIECSQPPVSQTDIADKMQRNPNGISMILSRMEKQGLLVRVRSKTDHRENIVSLTPKARQILIKALKVINALKKRLGSSLSTEEMQITMEACGKLRSHILEELGEQPQDWGKRAGRQAFLNLFKWGELGADRLAVTASNSELDN
jgi:DNA-binding MarR family transcriptional regulator